MCSLKAGICAAGKAVRPDSRPLCYCLARQHGPDLSLLLPRLRQEWDCEKNRHFDNVQIKPHSLKVCEWICSEGTADDPHHWDAVVANRTKGHGCPYCAGRRVSKRNSLATVAPDVAKSWCYEKNKGTPEDYTSRSHYKAAWACTACGNHWIAEIASRASSGTGCATCYNKRRGRRKDGSRRKHPTFTECNHALLSEWDHDRNAERGQFPQNITLGSHKPVHWVCRQCSLSILHRWVKTPNARTANQRGCPYCSGYAVCKCNSLATCCPEIAQDWDYSKNKAGPDEYTANSSKTGWWQNASRGSWQQIIQHRVYNWTRQQRNAIKQGELDLN
ncbi:TPA: hypothetical protein ACH3X2_006139 [Trebouxia sp. C0005]